MPTAEIPRILFLCVANSARSQMAEGLARHIFGSSAEVRSAGSQPTRLNPLAVAAMKEIGIDLSEQRSKGIDELPQGFLQGVSTVVTLCADEVCPAFVAAPKQLHWPLPDPAGHMELSAEAQLQRFRDVRDEIARRLIVLRSEILAGENVPDDYWQGRWKRGQTGWHQKEAEPLLTQHFPRITPTRVLVPLCGKSLDMMWLASQGHAVIGVELSEDAIRAFFDEGGIRPDVSTEGGFNVYRGDRFTIYQGDALRLEPETLPELGAIYDRAALIALPAAMRVRYSSWLTRVAKSRARHAGFRFLQVLLERNPPDSGGPPYSVSEAEFHALYEPAFSIARLSRDEVDANGPPGSRSIESAYLLSLASACS